MSSMPLPQLHSQVSVKAMQAKTHGQQKKYQLVMGWNGNALTSPQ